MVLAGDVNDPLAFGGAAARWTPMFERAFAPRTFPAVVPLLPLDRIWTRGIAVSEFRRASDPIFARASDHRPVTVLVAQTGRDTSHQG